MMEINSLEIEEAFKNVWDGLNLSQKQTLLAYASEIKEYPDEGFLKDYNKDIDAALEEVANGNFYTHMEVVRLLNEEA